MGHVGWVKEKIRINDMLCFSKQDVEDAVNYILSCYYFAVGNNIFSQIIGIFMGPDPASFFSNLFLHYYESRWIENLREVFDKD